MSSRFGLPVDGDDDAQEMYEFAIRRNSRAILAVALREFPNAIDEGDLLRRVLRADAVQCLSLLYERGMLDLSTATLRALDSAGDSIGCLRHLLQWLDDPEATLALLPRFKESVRGRHIEEATHFDEALEGLLSCPDKHRRHARVALLLLVSSCRDTECRLRVALQNTLAAVAPDQEYEGRLLEDLLDAGARATASTFHVASSTTADVLFARREHLRTSVDPSVALSVALRYRKWAHAADLLHRRATELRGLLGRGGALELLRALPRLLFREGRVGLSHQREVGTEWETKRQEEEYLSALPLLHSLLVYMYSNPETCEADEAEEAGDEEEEEKETKAPLLWGATRRVIQQIAAHYIQKEEKVEEGEGGGVDSDSGSYLRPITPLLRHGADRPTNQLPTALVHWYFRLPGGRLDHRARRLLEEVGAPVREMAGWLSRFGETLYEGVLLQDCHFPSTVAFIVVTYLTTTVRP